MSTILIVDDHADNLHLLRTQLASEGFDVTEAKDGAEALTMARAHPPALIVSDLLMPVLDGYALLRQCRSDERLKDVPFIVYTATYTDPKDERLALVLGADAFLTKPAEPTTLIAAIRDALARHQRGDSLASGALPDEEAPLLKQYNEVLVRKLEKKARQLELANRTLLDEILEHRKTEALLGDSEERYRSLFNAITDPLFVYDRETLRYLAVNDAAMAKYGYDRDEFLAMTIIEIRPVEDVALLLAHLASADVVRRGVWRHRKKDGGLLHVEISAHPLKYGGRPAYLIQANDLTMMRRTEAEAARTNELLRAVSDGISDAVFVKGDDGKYLLFNKAAASFVGMPAEAVLGKDDRAVFDADSARISMESDRLVMQANQTLRREELLTAGGVSRLYEAIKSPYRNSLGKVIGVIGVSRDITDRRRAEDSMRQQQALLRIAGRVAHIGGWSLDLVEQKLRWSDEICAIHEEPIGFQPALDIAIKYYAPEYREQIARHVQACAADGTPFDGELELITAKGRRIWVRSIGEACRDANGRIVALQGAFQDITALKFAEGEQRRLAEQLATTLETITDGFFTLDREWRFTYINAEAERMIDGTREKLLGTTVWDAFPGTLGIKFEREYRRAVAEQTTADFEEYYAPLDRWFSARAYPTEGGLAVYFRDVTITRRAEQSVRMSEERFRLLSKATSDVVWEWDMVSGAHSWNDGVTSLFGYAPAEIDQTIEFSRQCIHPEDIGALDAVIAEAMEDGSESWTAEYRFRCRDGSYKSILDCGYIIRDDAGKAIRMLGGMKDLTERHRVEEAMRLRDRAIQAVSQGILITDPNQPDHPIIYANDGVERLTGYRAQELMGRNCRLFQGRDTDPESVRKLRVAIAHGRSCTVELLNYRKDGTVFWNSMSLGPVRDGRGAITYFVGVQSDITERKQLEAQLQHSQKMEAVGRLAGGVAHDFNNLLTIISGNSELLLATSDVSPDVRESVESISEAGERAAALTRQLLSFSRRSLLQPRVLDLNGVVAQTANMLRRLIGEDVQLETVLDPKLSRVNVDPGQLDQVMMNLAVNARDAMPRGGKLTIETRDMVISNDYAATHLDCMAGPHVMLAMTDTGCGMTPDVMQQIFEPFFTTKDVGKGTGMGLAIVFGIVQQSGGCIHVESEPGHGTTFRIFLPAVSEPLSAGRSQDSNLGLRGTETILLVEDEDGVRAVALKALTAQGYAVLSASDGEEALRVARAHDGRIDLIVSDVVMPVLGGPELVVHLKRDLPDVAVLFMSGYIDDAVIRHELIEAETAFIQKPYTPLGLARKVREVLDRRWGEPG